MFFLELIIGQLTQEYTVTQIRVNVLNALQL